MSSGADRPCRTDRAVEIGNALAEILWAVPQESGSEEPRGEEKAKDGGGATGGRERVTGDSREVHNIARARHVVGLCLEVAGSALR